VLNLTLAIFRSAELGFLGFMMETRTQTPFMHGRFPSDSAGDTGFRAFCGLRHPLRTWLKVAQRRPSGLVGSEGGATKAGILGAMDAVAAAARASGEPAAIRGRRQRALRRANMAAVGGVVSFAEVDRFCSTRRESQVT
jgi:hypothetical protein